MVTIQSNGKTYRPLLYAVPQNGDVYLSVVAGSPAIQTAYGYSYDQPRLILSVEKLDYTEEKK